MVRVFLSVMCLLLLSACGDGVSLYVSDEENHHYRTFARITDAEDTENTHFTVKKRDREVMAEKEFYRSKSQKSSMSMAAGKHRDKDWSAGIVYRYGF